MFVYAPVAIFILFYVVLWLGLDGMREARVGAFESHRSEVHVSESSTHYGADGACANLSTVARIQNDGDVAWEDPVVEVHAAPHTVGARDDRGVASSG